jgi:PAS domain S-box-containing protein
MFRYFLLISLGATAVILLVAGFAARLVLRDYVLREAQADAVRTSVAIHEFTMRHGFVRTDRDGKKVLTVPEEKLVTLDQGLRTLVVPFDILKLRLYDTEMRIIYCTDGEVAGKDSSRDAGLAAALAGTPVSRYFTGERAADIAAEAGQRATVVKTYVPVRGLERGIVIGALEIDKDVTEDLATARKAVIRGGLVLLAVVCAAFGALSLLMYRAGRAIDSSDAVLRESEEKYRQLFSASDAIVIFDGMTGKVVDANDAAIDLYGYTRDELLKLSLEDLCSGAESSQWANLFAGGGLKKAQVSCHRKKGGKTFPAEITAGGFMMRNRRLFFCLITDITERKRAEDEIQSLARFPDENPHPVLRVSGGGVVLYANEASSPLLEAWHSGHGQLLPTTWHRFVRDALDSKSVCRTEVKCDGLIFSLTFAPVAEANYVNVHALDITDRKRAEEALARHATELAALNKELEAFAHSVSHGLRAPLRSMQSFSQLLLEDCRDKLDEQGKDYLRRICSAGRQMEELIDDLLNLSRATRGEMKREVVDMTALARGIAEELRRAQPQRNVDCVIHDGLIAHADKGLMSIALEHLLDNAWKFTSKCPEARIECGAMEIDGKRTYFIRDDGAGFDSAYAHRLFEAFQRLHAATDFPGTGIGLATVQHIVRRHGGRIWAEGAVDRGATFFFTLE